MPFIPHTPNDTKAMLAAIDAQNITELFDEIPKTLKRAKLEQIPVGMTELEITREMTERQPAVYPGACFIGAGAYEHHSPAAVWDLVGRGEFYTAYTPYQPEASQGNLQIIYEYQTMMANLMGMKVSNASLYDGASALAEAILMAVRLRRSTHKRVLIPKTVHPFYRAVLKTVLQHQDIVLEELEYSTKTGCLEPDCLEKIDPSQLAAIVIPQPNFFGVLEAVDELTDRAQALGAYVIAQVNPMAMALLKEPGSWGKKGADIACGEGQPLGIPLQSGGPYFGFICCQQEYVRQMPGRIVGRTVDEQNREGFVLTLQAREQHIRRAKATSNICTNQGLMVTAATIYMSLLGAQGLREVAAKSHENAVLLLERLRQVRGVSAVFASPFFHEFVLKLDKPVEWVLAELAKQDLQAGFDITKHYPELGECLLVCATETKILPDLERYQQLLAKVMQA